MKKIVMVVIVSLFAWVYYVEYQVEMASGTSKKTYTITSKHNTKEKGDKWMETLKVGVVVESDGLKYKVLRKKITRVSEK